MSAPNYPGTAYDTALPSSNTRHSTSCNYPRVTPPTDFSETKPTYKNLLEASITHQIVFRIHDKTSAAPLVWTGDLSTSGFSSPNRNLSLLTSATYRQALWHNYRKDWANDSYKLQSMIDHILCFHPFKQDLGYKAAMAPDELSPWVSTTNRLDRGIYECARRLASGAADLVRMAVIRRPQQHERNSPLTRAYPLYALPHVYLKRIDTSESIQRAIIRRAAEKAIDWHESLYYGRIFSTLVEADLVWTKDYLPIALPAKFWRPKSMPELDLPGWLGRLRWNAMEDDYQTAAGTMNVSFPQSSSWYEQPVHSWSSRWPLVPLCGE